MTEARQLVKDMRQSDIFLDTTFLLDTITGSRYGSVDEYIETMKAFFWHTVLKPYPASDLVSQEAATAYHISKYYKKLNSEEFIKCANEIAGKHRLHKTTTVDAEIADNVDFGMSSEDIITMINQTIEGYYSDNNPRTLEAWRLAEMITNPHDHILKYLSDDILNKYGRQDEKNKNFIIAGVTFIVFSVSNPDNWIWTAFNISTTGRLVLTAGVVSTKHDRLINFLSKWFSKLVVRKDEVYFNAK